ncbi:MAG: alpha/beta hydrolase [Gammaproteobacteria bacterium]
MRRLGTFAGVLAAVLLTTWVSRALLSRNLPDLQRWHRPVLQSEYRARDYPHGITFAEYRQLESRLMAEMSSLFDNSLPPAQQHAANRYYKGAPAHPDAWPSNWNLSYERIPESPRGGVVLLHGASDSPYSMRALAQLYFEANLYVIAPRLPGHGTIPGALTEVRAQDWTSIAPMALTRVREQIGYDKPIYLGGFSAGAGLALNYALSAAGDRKLAQVEGLYMFSPAVAVSHFAVFARWDAWVSKIPAFEKFAWLSVRPEYDPFKYSSFPKQAGHIVNVVASENRELLLELESAGRLQNLPPTMTFQSVVDGTVSVPEILDLHQLLSAARGELVLFDVNRNSLVIPFLHNDGSSVLHRVARDEWRHVDVTIVRNHGVDDSSVVAQRQCGATENCTATERLAARWPRDTFSLSHIALPFPPDDPLNGPLGKALAPGGYNLGQIRAMGERHVLVIPAEDTNRIRYNPFFAYIAARALAFCQVCTPARE